MYVQQLDRVSLHQATEPQVPESQPTGILDTVQATSLDDLLAIAADLCDAPVSALTLEGGLRVFYRSTTDLKPTHILRSSSIRSYTIESIDALIVEDLLIDERLMHDEQVQRSGARFYAGVPVSAPGTSQSGTVCVLGGDPRKMSFKQKQSLLRVGRQISNLLHLYSEKRTAQSLADELNKQNHLSGILFESSPVEMHLKDKTGRIVVYNRAFAERFRIGMAEWIGKTSFDLLPHAMAIEVSAEEYQVRSTGRSRTIYVEVPDGTEASHWRSTRIPCVGAEDSDMVLCVSVDITNEVRSKQQLEETQRSLEAARSQLQGLLKRDDVTNLFNRRGFEASCLAALFTLQTSGQPFAVIEIELGALSLLNRRLGPHVVDELLRDIGYAIQQNSSSAETPARIAGGSFRVLVNDASQKTIDEIVNRIAHAIEAITWPGSRLSPRTSSKFFANRQMHAGDMFSAPSKAAVKHSPYKVDAEKARRQNALAFGQTRIAQV